MSIMNSGRWKTELLRKDLFHPDTCINPPFKGDSGKVYSSFIFKLFLFTEPCR